MGHFVSQSLWESVEVGADRVLWAALDKKAESGKTLLFAPKMDTHLQDYLKNTTAARLILKSFDELMEKW
jgi:hypothetical protein